MTSRKRSRFTCVLTTAMLAVTLSACTSEHTGETGSTTIDDRVAEATSRQRESDGGAMLLQAIDAHGGLWAWYAAPTSS